MPSDIQVWKFTPVAVPEDSRWLDHRPVAALYVAAESPAAARIVAAKADVPPGQGKVGNESGHAHSRFEDEKLYRVEAASDQDLAALPAPPGEAKVLGEIAEDGTVMTW
jgi:hypothetical protein